MLYKVCKIIILFSSFLHYSGLSPFADFKPDGPDVKGHEAGIFNAAFNDKQKDYQLPDFDPEEFPAIHVARSKIDLKVVAPRPYRTLYKKYTILKRRYGEVYSKYDKSGRNSNLAFSNFCKGDVVIQYAHLLSKENELFSQIITKRINGAYGDDVIDVDGISSSSSSSSSSSPSSSSSSSNNEFNCRKRKKPEDDAFLKMCAAITQSMRPREQISVRVQEPETSTQHLQQQIVYLSNALKDYPDDVCLARGKKVLLDQFEHYCSLLEKSMK